MLYTPSKSIKKITKYHNHNQKSNIKNLALLLDILQKFPLNFLFQTNNVKSKRNGKLMVDVQSNIDINQNTYILSLVSTKISIKALQIINTTIGDVLARKKYCLLNF